MHLIYSIAEVNILKIPTALALDEKQFEKYKHFSKKFYNYVLCLSLPNGKKVIESGRKTSSDGLIKALHNVLKLYTCLLKKLTSILITHFEDLLKMVDGMLKKEDTVMRMAIPVITKLEVTLRYLAIGDSFKSLQYLFRVPESTISIFLPEVLSAISFVLRPFIEVCKN